GSPGESHRRPHLRLPRPTDPGGSMTNNLNSERPSEEPPIGEAENAIELRAVEGKSQGRIVRERFFAHRGAMVGMVALIAITVLALSAIGFGFLNWHVSGWWQWTPQETNDLVRPNGAPTMSMPWSDAGFAFGSHPFGQDTL